MTKEGLPSDLAEACDEIWFVSHPDTAKIWIYDHELDLWVEATK